MRNHVVVATYRLPLRHVGPPLLGLPSDVEPQGARLAAVCAMGYANDTCAITLAPESAPMSETPEVIH